MSSSSSSSMKRYSCLTIVSLLIMFTAMMLLLLLSSSSSSFIINAQEDTATDSTPDFTKFRTNKNNNEFAGHDYMNALRQRPFRCFRPFASLRTFTPKDMDRKENCEFAPFMRIVDASAKVNCYHNKNNKNDEAGKDGCYVTLNFTAEKFDEKNPNYHPAHFEQFFKDRRQLGLNLDSMRYGIELKALGSSTVRYKGFENKGYSVCCSMLKKDGNEDNTDNNEEICEWTTVSGSSDDDKKVAASSDGTSDDNKNDDDDKKEQQQGKKAQFHTIKSATSCPINDPSYDPQLVDGKKVYGKFIQGEITRPLHKKIFGRWEARIEFYQDTVDHGVGRIIIPFDVKVSDDDFATEEEQQDASSSSSSATAVESSIVTVGKTE